jgi:hypothetical protein
MKCSYREDVCTRIVKYGIKSPQDDKRELTNDNFPKIRQWSMVNAQWSMSLSIEHRALSIEH